MSRPLSRDASVLRLLRQAEDHLPPSYLAQEAGLTLAQLEECTRGLTEAGFEIENRPGFGYRLLAAPDRLIADDLWARLAPEAGGLVREIIVLHETGSTNDVAAQLGRDGIGGGTVVLAERQTAGRGRFGRRWESASHRGLWMSLLLRPALPLEEWPRLTTWAAVAVAVAIERVARCPARIKWPNDVEVAGGKAAGLLAEVGVDQRGERFVVLGIGLNVNHTAQDFPPELTGRATSLALATGSPQDRAAVAVALLEELAATWGGLAQDFRQIVRAAAARSTLLGHMIEAHSGNTIHQGLAEGLDANGHLLLRTSDDRLIKLTAGEVTLRSQRST